ncbi:MAG: glucose-6-phosphate isomerase [Sedimentisphaerales bacterium]|nr:glucose-6-phosphate isomerase [Sedimentisphaerales bacterium]
MTPGEYPNPIDPFAVLIDLEKGTMPEHTNHLVRLASDMRGYYADSRALESLISGDADPLHYEVFEIPVIPEQAGQLMYCISKLQPGKIGDEFFMTKGHYHTVADTAEIYLCLKGGGYMLMKTAGGKCAAEKMARGTMVYVPPFWAHRSVNTSGDEPLISFCVYPGNAGHNYGDIEAEGFPKRIFERDGKIVIE